MCVSAAVVVWGLTPVNHDLDISPFKTGNDCLAEMFAVMGIYAAWNVSF